MYSSCVAGAMEEGNDTEQAPDYKIMSDEELIEFFDTPQLGQHTLFSKIAVVGPTNQGERSLICWFLRLLNYPGEYIRCTAVQHVFL